VVVFTSQESARLTGECGEGWASEDIVWALEKIVLASEDIVWASEDIVWALEKIVLASEDIVWASEDIVC